MADRSVDFLIVGAGPAGGTCVRRLREEGADGSILLVGREPDPPHERPPLSKGYLAGSTDRDDALLEPPSWYEEHDVELLARTSVMKLDAGERVAKLSTKEEVGFGRALLATGSNVRRLRVDGCDLDGIHYLRSFANSDAIRADADGAERVVCIGGSYIGCEVAATLTAHRGTRCSIVMLENRVLERWFGEEVAGFFHDLLLSKGIVIHGSDELERFEGSDGRVRRVVTKGGTEIDCDCVVIGAGVTPDLMLARGAGLEPGEQGGIPCSAQLETGVPGLFAAGDVAEYDSPIHGRPMRIEHYEVATAHGETAALNMMGRGIDHEVVPYFWSDLADWATLEYVGPGSGDPVIRGSLDDGDFTAFYVDDGRVTAALTVGRSDDLEHAKRFIKERVSADPRLLADAGSSLADIVS